MKVSPKTITRQVKVMRDPNPTFVSIVDHGAIQEPFKVLKRCEPKGVEEMAIKAREVVNKEVSMITGAVRKLVFSKKSYPDEKAVKAYLDGFNYADYAIKADGETFVAEGKDVTDTGFVKNSIKTIKMGDGVTGHVGRVVEATEETVQVPAQKQERAIKLDYYDMHQSKGTSVGSVLQDGMTDGVPPGINEVIHATSRAIGNTLKGGGDGRATSVESIASEMAGLINGHADLYSAAQKAAKTVNTTKFITQYDLDIGTLTAPVKKEEEIKVVEKKEAAVQVTEKKEAETTQVQKEDGASVIGAPEPPKSGFTVTEYPRAELVSIVSSAVSKAVTDAVQPVADAVKAVKAGLDELTKRVDTVQQSADEAREKATKAATEIAEVAARAPTKKSVAEQGDPTKQEEEEQAKATKSAGLTRFRNVIGAMR